MNAAGLYIQPVRENTNISNTYGATGGAFLGYDIKYNSGTKELDYRTNAYYRAYMSAPSQAVGTITGVISGLNFSLDAGVWLLQVDVRWGWLNTFVDGAYMTNYLVDGSSNTLTDSHRLICSATASGLAAVNGIQQHTAHWHYVVNVTSQSGMNISVMAQASQNSSYHIITDPNGSTVATCVKLF